MGQRFWLLVSLLGFILAVAIGIGIGVMLPRVSKSVTPPQSQTAGGVRVEERKDEEDLFNLAGQKARVFKYSGGDVNFWIELDRDGKTERFDPGMKGLRNLFLLDSKDPPGPEAQTEGYFVFCRQELGQSGDEFWVVAGNRGQVTATSSSLKLSTPLVEGEVVSSRKDQQNHVVSQSLNVSLWKEKQSDGTPISAGDAEFKWHEDRSISNPLPKGRKVCIMTITEEGKKNHPKEKEKELAAKHVIRIMCEIASGEDEKKK